MCAATCAAFLPPRPPAPEAAPPGNRFACVRAQTHTLQRSCSAPRKQVFHSRSRRAGAHHRPSSSSSMFHSPSTIAQAAAVLFHAAACGVAGVEHAVRIRLRQRWVKVPVAWYGPDRGPYFSCLKTPHVAITSTRQHKNQELGGVQGVS